MSVSGPQVAWVTGASSGLGEALSRALSRRGWALILSGRRSEALEAVAASIGGETLVLPFEATDFQALPSLVDRAIGWRGGVGMLVNNAGISQRSLAVDTSFDVYRTIMEVDFFAPLRLTQLVGADMVQRRSGRLVAISSLAGRTGSPLRTGYSAAKHALAGYYEALRAEWELAYGVQVTTVLPGSVRTRIAANALQGDGSVRGVSDANIDGGLDPTEAAEAIVRGIEAGQREIVIAVPNEARGYAMRAQELDRLWDYLAREGARLAVARESAGGPFRPDPALVV